MKAYRAARRQLRREAVEIPIEYEVEVADPDNPGQLVWEERTEVFFARGRLSALTASEVGYHADLATDTPEGAAILRRAFQEAFGSEEEYKRFYEFSTKYLDDDDVMEIFSDLLEEMIGRPTQRPAASPQQRASSGPGSKVVSLPGGFSTEAVPMSSSG